MPRDAVVGVEGIKPALECWRAFYRAFKRRFGAFDYYKVLEFQKRGVLHFHAVLRLPRRLEIHRVKRIAVGRRRVKHSRGRPWYRNHVLHRIIAGAGFGQVWEIEPVRTRAGIASYLGSYLSKPGDRAARRLIALYTFDHGPLRLHDSSQGWLLPGDRPAKPYRVWYLVGAGKSHFKDSKRFFEALVPYDVRLKCACRECTRFPSRSRDSIRARVLRRWRESTEIEWIPKGVLELL